MARVCAVWKASRAMGTKFRGARRKVAAAWLGVRVGGISPGGTVGVVRRVSGERRGGAVSVCCVVATDGGGDCALLVFGAYGFVT